MGGAKARWIARAGVIVVLCLALLAAGCSKGGKPMQDVAAPSATQTEGAGPQAAITTPEAASPTPEDSGEAVATPPPLPTPDQNAQFVRLVIPKAKVDNRIVTKGLNDKREMEDPGGKDDIAWYNFSTLPGY